MNETSPSPSGRRFRKLRTTFSAACGIACLLLIVLWVRSYSRMSGVWRVSDNGVSTRFGSGNGVVAFLHGKVVGDGAPMGWQSFSFPISKPLPTTQGKAPPKQSSFKLDRSGGKLVIRLPYWFLVVGSGLMVVMPWLPRRFSLRTLLIAMTLIAVLLGAVVWVAM